MIRVETCDVSERAAWNEFVDAHDSGTSYQRWDWGDCISRSLRLPVHNLAAFRGREICGILPLVEQANPLSGRLLISLPYVNYAGILADDAISRDALIEAAARLGRERSASYVELRHPPGVAVGLACARQKVCCRLALPKDPETLWNGMSSKVRAQVRRPRKANLVAEEGGGESLRDFYQIISRKWRTLGSPMLPFSFFRRVLEVFGHSTRLVVVRDGDKAVAAGWLHRYKHTTEILWAGTLRESDRLSPNMLLYWSAFQAAIRDGSRVFDFGRSERGAGTHRFKKQWGSETLDLPWHYVAVRAEVPPHPAGQTSAARLFRRVWTHLPYRVTIALGPPLARHFPL